MYCLSFKALQYNKAQYVYYSRFTVSCSFPALLLLLVYNHGLCKIYDTHNALFNLRTFCWLLCRMMSSCYWFFAPWWFSWSTSMWWRSSSSNLLLIICHPCLFVQLLFYIFWGVLCGHCLSICLFENIRQYMVGSMCGDICQMFAVGLAALITASCRNTILLHVFVKK